MMLYDFDMEKHIESEKAYEYERGIDHRDKFLVSKWLKKGKSLSEIAEDLDRSEEYVRALV